METPILLYFKFLTSIVNPNLTYTYLQYNVRNKEGLSLFCLEKGSYYTLVLHLLQPFYLNSPPLLVIVLPLLTLGGGCKTSVSYSLSTHSLGNEEGDSNKTRR